MRLFSAKELTESKKKQTDTQIARGIKVAKLVDDEEQKLRQLQEQREAEQKKISDEFSQLFNDLNAKRTALESEIGGLEARKAEALKPIDDLKRILQLKETEFKSLQITFETQEQELLSKEIQLAKEQAGLDSLKQQMAQEREKFDLKLLNLKAQENAVNEGFQNLQSQWSEFISSTQQSAELVTDWERELGQKEKAFQILQGEIRTQKKDIELNRTRLLDLQQTIQAAFAEARSKNLL